MATLLQVRNVPEAARRALKARAASSGQSLNSYMLAVIEREVARPTVGEVLQRAAERSEHATGASLAAIDAGRRERDRTSSHRDGA